MRICRAYSEVPAAAAREFAGMRESEKILVNGSLVDGAAIVFVQSAYGSRANERSEVSSPV
jgi:hypothetical protein